ncbi:DUF4142 domain-containing protein [Cereibacter sphaeroides]|uniref:DUF4142 domain-containing protein n=1 Tax=Cereibacter sphaeroides TaxID=1063 RepID=UPI001F19FBB9|nr:DUF4142 domain-containing protein [Cereibacter sphaeroides]MCE6949552.1 DUF4142 domain-containing protein [Cereibacter sphaeroides]
MFRTLTAATATTFFATAAWSQQAEAVTDPAEFAQKAAVSNMFEIQSSQVALEKGVEGEVADFAQRMVDDHTAAGERMKAAASEAGVEVPAELDAEHQAKLESLQAAQGADLMRAYVDAQMQGHEQAVQLFEGFSTGGPDGPLKDFAGETLPTLHDHAEMIRGIAGE